MRASNGHTARKRAAGPCRKRRRHKGARRPEWVRSYRIAQNKLDAAVRLMRSAMNPVNAPRDSWERRPVHAARRLHGGARGLVQAGLCLLAAWSELTAAKEALARAPELEWTDAPLLVDIVAERWTAAYAYLQYVTSEVALRQLEVLSGLACGELKAEHPSDHRPRIVRASRPVFIRAFLARRRQRVADRITPVLQRRRRTPRPAALLIPPRASQGRAPPLSSLLSSF